MNRRQLFGLFCSAAVVSLVAPQRDDTDYLQCLLNSGRRIPPGIYTCSRTLVVTRGNTVFENCVLNSTAPNGIAILFLQAPGCVIRNNVIRTSVAPALGRIGSLHV